jgi:glycerophosphoryl diester phosphodiesterase
LHGRPTIRDRLQAARAEGRMLLGGHRGNPADFPENTIPSYESAIAAGCDLIECDVHLTADGRLAVIHDHLVDRTTDGQGLVGGMTMAELKELDAGGGARIPELHEVLDVARGRVGLAIETKQNPVPYPGLEEKLVEVLRAAEMIEEVSVISFHHERIAHLKSLAPELDVGIIDASRPVDVIGMLRAAKADLWSSFWGTLDPDTVAAVRGAGGAVGVWTVDDEIGAMWMKVCRPDSVFTNRPREIAPLLA